MKTAGNSTGDQGNGRKGEELHEMLSLALIGDAAKKDAKKNKKVVAFFCGCGIISEPQAS